MKDILFHHLAFLYGEDNASSLRDRVQSILRYYRARIPARSGELSERDSLLITYGDQVQAPDEKPLRTLKKFCDTHLTDAVSGIHILPFYPWTSDDGFSVMDYRRIDPALGNWDDVSALGNFRLMFDGVINHISSQSDWFQKFLQDDLHYLDYFIVVDGERIFRGWCVRARCHYLPRSRLHPAGKKCGRRSAPSIFSFRT